MNLKSHRLLDYASFNLTSKHPVLTKPFCWKSNIYNLNRLHMLYHILFFCFINYLLFLIFLFQLYNTCILFVINDIHVLDRQKCSWLRIHGRLKRKIYYWIKFVESTRHLNLLYKRVISLKGLRPRSHQTACTVNIFEISLIYCTLVWHWICSHLKTWFSTCA